MPEGIISAAESHLEEASESCERWEWGCAGVVVASVVFEFIIAWIHPEYDSFLEQWGAVFADAAIALGIVGEVIFSRKDSKIQTELRKRSNDKLGAAERAAADANAVAATAQKEAAAARERAAEVERFHAWRRLSPEQVDQIVRAIRRKLPAQVKIESEKEPEAIRFARTLENVFIDADAKSVSRRTNHVEIGLASFWITFLGQSRGVRDNT